MMPFTGVVVPLAEHLSPMVLSAFFCRPNELLIPALPAFFEQVKVPPFCLTNTDEKAIFAVCYAGSARGLRKGDYSRWKI
jgi:hypothetical protein